MPCQDADPQARQTHPLRNDADNVGIAVPTFLKSHQPLVPRVPCAPTGSIQCETSASCGPVATPSGSLIRPLAEAKNRTTRVLTTVRNDRVGRTVAAMYSNRCDPRQTRMPNQGGNVVMKRLALALL